MNKPKSLDELAKSLADALPEGVRQAGEDVQNTFHRVLQSGFHSMDLVTREQFDIQAQVLARTRKKLEALEKKVTELEKQAQSKAAKNSKAKS